MSLLTVRDLTVSIGATRPVDGVSFGIAAGETFALVGESGCGKSMTALALMRLLPNAASITGGAVHFGGVDLLARTEADMRTVRGGRIGMIFQEPATSLNPVLTVGAQIEEALRLHAGGDAPAKVVELLAAVGIPDPERRAGEYPFQMSGGMKQRVMIAMALAGEPELLIADEPTTALDVTIQAQVLDLLHELKTRRGMALLLITHDLGVVARMADRVGVMRDGRLVEMAVKADFFHAPAHPYSRALFDALPENLDPPEQKSAPAQSRKPEAVTPALVEAHVSAANVTPEQKSAPAQSRKPEAVTPALVEAHVSAANVTPEQKSAPAQSRKPEAVTPALVEAHVSAANVTPEQKSALAGRQEAKSDEPALVEAHVSAANVTPEQKSALAGRQEAKSDEPALVEAHVSAANVTPEQKSVPAGRPALLEVRDLRVHFPIRRGLLQRVVAQVKAVDGVDLALAAGRTLALVGESGCGKTTAGKVILGLLERTDGQVELDGAPVDGLVPERMQMVFQDPFGSLDPRMCVGEIVAEGKGDADVAALLEQVGLDAAMAKRYPHEFSGGQRQRIAIARALAVHPALLICDEPTSALDVSVQAQVLKLLVDLQARFDLAYLFITHNIAVVDYLAHEVAVMYLGRIVERGTTGEVLRSPRHPYTQALLAAVPRLSGERGEKLLVHGDPPSPANPPSGCHFHPRCPRAAARCREAYPGAAAISASHFVTCHFPT